MSGLLDSSSSSSASLSSELEDASPASSESGSDDMLMGARTGRRGFTSYTHKTCLAVGSIGRDGLSAARSKKMKRKPRRTSG